MSRLLLVEDTPAFADLAQRVAERYDYDVLHAEDYRSGMDNLGRADKVVSDLMLPEEKGTGKKTLGYKVIEATAKQWPRVRAHIHREEEMRSLEEVFTHLDAVSEATGSDYTRLKTSLQRIARHQEEGEAVKKGRAFIQNLPAPDNYTERRVENYRLGEEALERSEANQPLGLLVAGAAAIFAPAVVATADHHHERTVENYFARSTDYAFTIVEGIQRAEDEKSSPKLRCDYWEKVLESIDNKGGYHE